MAGIYLEQDISETRLKEEGVDAIAKRGREQNTDERRMIGKHKLYANTFSLNLMELCS